MLPPPATNPQACLLSKLTGSAKHTCTADRQQVGRLFSNFMQREKAQRASCVELTGWRAPKTGLESLYAAKICCVTSTRNMTIVVYLACGISGVWNNDARVKLQIVAQRGNRPDEYAAVWQARQEDEKTRPSIKWCV
jgi:hypothetical protein